MKIGIINSGGDCPGLNAVIHSIVRTARKHGDETVGFKDGFQGILDGSDLIPLTLENTENISKLGGTILGSSNRNRLLNTVNSQSESELVEHICEARERLDKESIGAYIVVGGEGSLRFAHKLHQLGWPIIGIPKTIDNDLSATAMTFGFDSAVTTVVDGLDRLHTTAESHSRIMVLETMGRNAGWIALWGGIAGGANVILIPEIPFDIVKVADFINNRDAEYQKGCLVVVAEGATTPSGDQIYSKVESTGHSRLGGIGQWVADELEKRTNKDVRYCALGHLQRGGSPTALDRVLGARFGVKAVQIAKKGQFGRMVSYQSYKVDTVPLDRVVNSLKQVDPLGEMVNTAKSIGIHMGDD